MSCNYNATREYSKADSARKLPDLPENLKINKEIANLLEGYRYKQANRIIDSLILKDEKNGFYYYEKGVIYEDKEAFDVAIPFYKRAEQLSYRKKLCDVRISFCKRMIRMKAKFQNSNDTLLL